MMSRLFVAALGCVALVAAAHAQNNVRIRGTITAVDAATLSVKSRDGRDLTLALPENATVSYPRAVRFDEIREGDLLGATTKTAANGSEVAIELHYLPPTASQGQGAWDLEPNSKMTNAIVQAKVVGTGTREITVQFPGGTQKIVVPDGTPIVRSLPGSRADLKVGEYVFVSAQSQGEGALTALRVQVGKDGVRPPQ
ncbi:MAG: DUF5666 domain-containing protein [Burkholderiales bacterium]